MTQHVQAVEFDYENWRGERGRRQVVPLKIWYGSTRWHPKPQWLLSAYDLDKEAERDFALADITTPITPIQVTGA